MSKRKRIGLLGVKWNTKLTAEDRKKWIDVANGYSVRNSIGKLVPLTGFNYFIMQNGVEL